MAEVTYSFKHAVNYSMDFHNYYFVCDCDEFVVVINGHIGIWKRDEDQLNFLYNVLHDYENPKWYFRGSKHIPVYRSVGVDKVYCGDYYDFIDIYDITKLKYRKIIDLNVPQHIVEWQKLTTMCLESYNLIDALEINGYVDNIEDIKYEIFYHVFNYSDLKLMKKQLKYIEKLYAELKGDIDSVFSRTSAEYTEQLISEV